MILALVIHKKVQHWAIEAFISGEEFLANTTNADRYSSPLYEIPRTNNHCIDISVKADTAVAFASWQAVKHYRPNEPWRDSK